MSPLVKELEHYEDIAELGTSHNLVVIIHQLVGVPPETEMRRMI